MGLCRWKNLLIRLFLVFVVMLQQTKAQEGKNLWCATQEPTNPGPQLPDLPKLFSTHIQVNYESHGFQSEIIRKVDQSKKREYLEIKSGTRHVIYISLGEDDAFLTINYTPNGPVCKTDLLSQTDKRSIFDEKDTGPLGILQLAEDRIYSKKQGFKSQSSLDFIRGIPALSWKLCETFDQIGAAVELTAFFSDETWVPAHPKYSKIGDNIKNELIRIQGQAKEVHSIKEKEILFIADYYDYEALILEDKDFLVPEAIHCPGYRGQMKITADLPMYFSYNSEMINYTTALGTAPVVTHQMVYYDFKEGLARVNYQEASQDGNDPYTPLTVTVRSFIYDFNLGIQYSFEPLFGTCSVEVMKSSLDVFGSKGSSQLKMLDTPTFFYLNVKNNNEPLSYKGLYKTRGLPADVYSSKVRTGGKDRTFFWYFTSDRTKLIEDEVEKNVLVKMVSRPETGSGSIGKEDEIEINFYNFVKEEPSDVVFDITPCFNESLSKEFVITFPGNFNFFVEDALYLLKIRMQKAIQDITLVSRHRVFIQQIHFRSPYLLVQFKILDLPPVEGNKPSVKENNLETAMELMKQAVNKGKFSVEFRTRDNKNIILQPEPNGLKEFQGERSKPAKQVYNEGSFVGMSIGMTVLGFLLGGIIVNLIITRKYGVSLLQRPGSGETNFNNPLNESSM